MRRRMVLEVTVVITLCLLPGVVHAKHHRDDGAGLCQERVSARISYDHPASRGTWFDPSVQHGRYGNNAEVVSGRGRVRTAKGKNRGFKYSCVYNYYSGRLSSVKYSFH